MRVEVLILLALVLAFIAAWLLTPAWLVSGPSYSLRLMPWGFIITFFGATYTVPPLIVYLVLAFSIATAIAPHCLEEERLLTISIHVTCLTIANHA